MMFGVILVELAVGMLLSLAITHYIVALGDIGVLTLFSLLCCVVPDSI